ncbi:sel1 repeat family protein [Asticcacaulis biprosthecium C19]|uniref:Sel1 repeat family protein n=1 Tax=Asticcacaulis biprosthecium C19 TaxID=715226 RepID=F4QL74_9CAUL|nr:tetratricopeptide repeat protein [Asticcacaulis biprosthecium]EGF93449.1 sel1 repeat family protein [Asticcacaulis biprosthecium C19]
MAAWDRGDIGGGHQYFLQAAQKGYAPAQYMAGSDLRHGYGVKKDISLAMPWLLKAAEQGLADAQNDYAKVYFYGEDGIEADPEKAIPWLRRAADQGYLHSQTLLAEAYYNATGVDQDTDKGLVLYTKAAEGGHGFAQYNLGTIYSNGINVPRDDTKAKLWLETAARRNVVEAQLKLAQLYEDKARLNDPVKALTWFLVYAGGEGLEAPTEIATLSQDVSAEQVKEARTDAEGIRAKLPEDWRDVL